MKIRKSRLFMAFTLVVFAILAITALVRFSIRKWIGPFWNENDFEGRAG
jgi:hypothetical protein